jgi:hypothetical protein
MKATSFKQFTTTLMLITTMSFSSVIFAEEVALPVIAKPAILQEGTQRELSAAQIAELLPWAKNSKLFLNDLLESLQGLSSADKLSRMVDGITSVVGESAPKNSELLMRYVLNRGLVVNEILSKQVKEEEVGTIDVKIRVLISSIKLAVKYYDDDVNTMTKKASAPFAKFGVDYNEFLTELNKSIFDASAQYNIQRISLEWLQWDLYRDLNNASYAPQIVKINNSLKVFPANVTSDRSALSYIKQMKLVSSQLGIVIAREQKKNSDLFQESSYSGGSYRAASNGKCYGYDTKTGNLITSQSVDNAYCIKNEYRAASNGYCYGYDSQSGYLLSSETVSNANCIKDEYRAASNGKCYGYDSQSGYLLTSKEVNNSYCIKNEYRAGSNGYCYGYDSQSGYLLSSEPVSNANCIKDEYRAASNGKCYGYDSQSGYLLTSKEVDKNYCSGQ